MLIALPLGSSLLSHRLSTIDYHMNQTDECMGFDIETETPVEEVHLGGCGMVPVA